MSLHTFHYEPTLCQSVQGSNKPRQMQKQIIASGQESLLCLLLVPFLETAHIKLQC